MYRDDTCAVCGESLPPDHFYCREHAAEVDDRLHAIGALLDRVAQDVGRLAALLEEVAVQTWDWLAEAEEDEPDWPPVPRLALRTDSEEVSVDVDREPGMVAVDLRVALPQVLAALARSLGSEDLGRFALRCAAAEGANTTH